MVALEGASAEPQRRRRRRALLVTLLIVLIAVGVLFAAFVVRDGFDGGSSTSHGSGSNASGAGGLPKGVAGNANDGGEGGGLANIDSNTPLVLGGDASSLLIPGSTSPINISITNRTSHPATLTGLQASIASVTAPLATTRYPCNTNDYVVNQFVPGRSFVAPALSTVTLSSLGFARSAWPSITMTASATDQRGCAGATVSLVYQTTETH